MNRRQFNQSLAALAVAPTVPAGAFAAPAPTQAARAGLYPWSVAIARTHGKCSADMLATMLKVDTGQAAGLMRRLIAQNVLGATNASGISMAKATLPPQTGSVAKPVQALQKLGADLPKDNLRTVLTDEEPSPPNTERAEETPARDPNSVETEA